MAPLLSEDEWLLLELLLELLDAACRLFLLFSSFFGLEWWVVGGLLLVSAGCVVSTSDDSCFSVCVKFLLASASACVSNFAFFLCGGSQPSPAVSALPAVAVGGVQVGVVPLFLNS